MAGEAAVSDPIGLAWAASLASIAVAVVYKRDPRSATPWGLLISGGTPVGITAVGRAGICAFAETGRDLSGDNCLSNRCAAQKAAYFSAFVML